MKASNSKPIEFDGFKMRLATTGRRDEERPQIAQIDADFRKRLVTTGFEAGGNS